MYRPEFWKLLCDLFASTWNARRNHDWYDYADAHEQARKALSDALSSDTRQAEHARA